MKKYYTKDYVDDFGVVRVYGCYDDTKPLSSRPMEWISDLIILEIDDYRVKMEHSKDIVREEDTRRFTWISEERYKEVVNTFSSIHNKFEFFLKNNS